MIPQRAADLAPMIEEAVRQTSEVRDLVTRIGPEAAAWRPNETRWSTLGHLAHLCILNGTYLTTLRPLVDAARAKAREPAEGPYKHPWIGSWFARSMEPPPKRRLKTARSMVPDPSVENEDVVERFAELQAELRGLMEDARGLDLGRLRFGSPFLSVLRLSVGTAFEVLLAHNRRHIWLIRELHEQEGFPGPTAARDG